ncbi:MAG TPA: energy transducer TonB [Pyrinomonadaceae bacterium]|nr:energy transducer TonB [Pyrinomonadaceae bacterium]
MAVVKREHKCSVKLYLVALLLLLPVNARAQTSKVSVLDFGSQPIAQQVADILRTRLRASGAVQVTDADLSRSAAKGIGYSGSLNLTVSEARDLGAALATEFYIIGDAQTLRRSSFERPVYFQSYCSIFLVSTRTGNLLFWDRPSFENTEATRAEALLSQHIKGDDLTNRLIAIIRKAQEEERIQRTVLNTPVDGVIEEAPDDEKAAADQGIRLPRPFKRLWPGYPDTAARAEAEATVDVAVNIGADGEVGEVQIVRWAGFGLDESTVATVRQLHFFPAMKNSAPIPIRVLLRYNFRKPPR